MWFRAWSHEDHVVKVSKEALQYLLYIDNISSDIANQNLKVTLWKKSVAACQLMLLSLDFSQMLFAHASLLLIHHLTGKPFIHMGESGKEIEIAHPPRE